ncbi:hypothetical protein ABZX74_38700 [Streptomyces olivaceoviridis]|uniref:hypothetical protein n=1 Tax=Streptomyces olivaceoviridis TaxID=1921 RepID=UPI0033B6C897
MRVLGAAVGLQQQHRHPGLRRPHHQVRPLNVAVAEPVRDLGLEAEPVADPGAVEFGGRRGDRRGVVVVASAQQLPGRRVVLLLAQHRDPYALRLQEPFRFAVTSRGEYPYLPLVLPHRLDPHQLVLLQIQQVVPRERLQNRLARRGVELLRLAQRRPRHYPVFDLVHAGGDVTGWPYER